MSSAFQVDFSDYSKTLEKYANELLDRKVALTDMTMRHIVSQFIVVCFNLQLQLQHQHVVLTNFCLPKETKTGTTCKSIHQFE